MQSGPLPDRHVPDLMRAERSPWSVRPWLASLLGFAVCFGFLSGTLVADAKLRQASLEDDARVVLDVFSARAQERIHSYLGALQLLHANDEKALPAEAFERHASSLVENFAAYQAVTVMTPRGVISGIVPLEGNESALGLDVNTVPLAADALDLARMTGRLAVTEPLTLAQGGLGFVGYLPLGNPPGSEGFYSAVFRAEDFMVSLLGERLPQDYALRVSDAGSPIYENGELDREHLLVSTRITVGQREWEMALSPRANSNAAGIALSVANAFWISLVASMFMAWLFHRLARGAFAELESRAEAWRIAHLSGLTGLPNRYSLMKALDEKRLDDGSSSCLLLIDLLQFRLINAVHGQKVADEVIRWVAARLSQACSEHEVFHLGGAEFAVLARDVKVRQANSLAERLQDIVNQHVELPEASLDIDGEVGFVHFAKPDADAVPMNQAAAALVRAKEKGGPQPYDSTVREEVQSRAFLEAELRLALEREQLQLHFQPICSLQDGATRTVGVEALLRWNHPDLGSVRPDIFIAIAEASGLIETIGRWVIRECCEQLVRWNKQGIDYRIGINISPRQMLDRSLARDIREILSKTSAPPDRIIVEITESLAISDLETAIQTLAQLQDIGVKVALDDFGTGYSSLSYLNQLPLDVLKIDRSLVDGLEQFEQSRQVARGVISLAHALGLQVVAEGVETAGQLEVLCEMNCDFAQGYYFDRPMPAEHIEQRFAVA